MQLDRHAAERAMAPIAETQDGRAQRRGNVRHRRKLEHGGRCLALSRTPWRRSRRSDGARLRRSWRDPWGRSLRPRSA